MDDEVLNEKSVINYLNSSFQNYHVFGFDSLAQIYRDKYKIKGDPTFLFLNEGKELHRIVGFYNSNEFISECKKAISHENLISKETKYQTNDYDLAFLRDYILTKAKAYQLDSSLTFKYLNTIPDTQISKEPYLTDIIEYAYYRGIWMPKSNSRYYKVLRNNYANTTDTARIELLRGRLIFSLYHDLIEINDQQSFLFDSLLNELKELEDGNLITLKDPHSKGFYSYIADAFPSFELDYFRYIKANQELRSIQILDSFALKVWDNHRELNSLAWGIYEDKYKAPIVTGIKLIQRAIELSPSWAYYDTYGALLYKNNEIQKAFEMVQYAIELAKNKGVDYYESELLLLKIKHELDQNKSK